MKKRTRRVTFAGPGGTSATPSSDEITKAPSPPACLPASRGTPEHSLLADKDPGVDPALVTSFDVEEELEDGIGAGEDGIIPKSLERFAGGSDNESPASSDSEVEVSRLRDINRESSPDGWVDDLENSMPGSGAYATGLDREPESKRRRSTALEDVDTTVTVTPSFANTIPALVSLLDPGETATKLLRRLKDEGKMKELGDTTDLCHALLGLGCFDVYSMRREQILGVNGTKWLLCWGARPTKNGSSADPTTVHGPFSVKEMGAWAEAKYFVQPGKDGWVRVEGEESEWWSAAVIFKVS